MLSISWLCAAAVLWACITAGVCGHGEAQPQSDEAVLHNRTVTALQCADPTECARYAGDYQRSLLSNGSWADINYADKSRAIWSPGDHTKRVNVMAQAWYKSPLQHNATLKASILLALDFYLHLDPTSDNWWWNEIAQPQSLSYIALLMEGELSSFQRERSVEIMKRAVWTRYTGANLVWMVETQIRRGLFVGNESVITAGYARLWEEVRVTSQQEDNIQHDNSFHQHGPELLDGSYGSVYTGLLADAIATVADLASYRPTPAQIAVFQAFVLDGQAWMIRGDHWDPSVVGREMTRPNGITGLSVSGWTALSRYPATRPAEMRALVQRLGRDATAPRLAGHRHYWDSDYTVHRRGDYLFSLKLNSARTVSAKCVNEEAKKSEHASQGVVLVQYNFSDSEYADVGPVWDWARLPGTTAEQGLPLLYCKGEYPVNPSRRVGGVSDGADGLSAMELSAHNLTLQRTWAMAGGRVLATGQNISLASHNPMATGLVARRRAGPVTAMLANGTRTSFARGNLTAQLRYLHHDQTGYVFTAGANTVSVSAGPRTGAWGDIGVHSGNVTIDMVLASIEHGSNLAAGSQFDYTMALGVSATDMDAISSDPGIRLVTQSAAAQLIETTATTSPKAFVAFWSAPSSVRLSSGQVVSVTQAPLLLTLNTTAAAAPPGPRGARAAPPIGSAFVASPTLEGPVHIDIAIDGASATLAATLPGGDFLGQTVLASAA